MLQSLLRPRAAADVRDQLVIAPHHPDRLLRPAPRLGAVTQDRFQQAVTWNVFRTLELVTPAFWLRRLHVRLNGDHPGAAPHIVKVSLWRPLPLPPIQRMDGARADAVADVVIETEHAVWALIVANARDHAADDVERIVDLVDATTWLAGARESYCGVIESATASMSPGALLRSRYSRSRESARLRSASSGLTRPALAGCGAFRWTDLAAVLHECENAENLSPIERALARNAVAWLQAAGNEGSPCWI